MSPNISGTNVDASTLAAMTVGYEHHEIHGGSHYFVDSVVELTSGDVFDLQWTTPDTAKWAHWTFAITCESETDWYIYEDVAINVAGTAVTAMNNNRNSSKTSTAVIKSIENASLELANADTAVAGATLLANGITGDNRVGGIVTREHEIVLAQDMDYCMRAVCSTNGYVNFRINWYEHTDKLATT